MIDELSDRSIVLNSGLRLKYADLAKILGELSNEKTLRAVVQDRISVQHVSSTFAEASRIFEVMHELPSLFKHQ